MIGRRSAAWLCVLLLHAAVLYALLDMSVPPPRLGPNDEFVSEPITWYPEPEESADELPAAERKPKLQPATHSAPRVEAKSSAPAAAIPAGESSPIASTADVDWPIEAKRSAARVLAAEAEAERIAKMFAGPGGTWASLTKRQRSTLSKFRWKPGVTGLEYDEKGNAIYHMPNGCTIVNLMFFSCPLGFKETIHGDMFENMREYFDEQRLPHTDEGNGTEPEARRPP